MLFSVSLILLLTCWLWFFLATKRDRMWDGKWCVGQRQYRREKVRWSENWTYLETSQQQIPHSAIVRLLKKTNQSWAQLLINKSYWSPQGQNTKYMHFQQSCNVHGIDCLKIFIILTVIASLAILLCVGFVFTSYDDEYEVNQLKQFESAPNAFRIWGNLKEF